MILSNLPKNCMKSRKFWAMGGVVGAPGEPPLNPPLHLKDRLGLESILSDSVNLMVTVTETGRKWKKKDGIPVGCIPPAFKAYMATIRCQYLCSRYTNSAIHKAAGLIVPGHSMISTGTIPVEKKNVP